MTAIIHYLDHPTLLSAARACRTLQIEAEALIYHAVFLSSISRVRKFVKALSGSANPHRALALRQLTICYFFKSARNIDDISPIQAILEKAIFLRHIYFYKPWTATLPTRPWHVNRTIVMGDGIWMLDSLRQDHNLALEMTCSACSFRVSETVGDREAIHLLRTFLRFTAPHIPPLTSLSISAWHGSPRLFSMIPKHIPHLKELEVHPYLYEKVRLFSPLSS